jgi:hypothetical protein
LGAIPTHLIRLKQGWISSQDGIPQTDPPTAPNLCDERLSQVDYAYWIEESIRDQDALEAISRYLENDHHVFGLFDADLFLNDLVTKNHRHCSPFMVIALLSWSLVSVWLISMIPSGEGFADIAPLHR